MNKPNLIQAPHLETHKLIVECHQDSINAGWYEDLKTGKRLKRNLNQMMMLILSEVAEAMEGERKGLMDDKLPHRQMAEVELADTIIRIGDYLGYIGYKWHQTNYLFELKSFCKTAEDKGEALWVICKKIVAVQTEGSCWERVVAAICHYCGKHGYDLVGAISEKRAYNAKREDHKIENRKKLGGKTF
jgi:hypothetical protein